jgi:hypothetical protein
MSQVTFEKIVGATNLYQPPGAPAGGKLLFLAAPGGGTEQTLTLEATWDASLTPAAIGYYLFLNQWPDPGSFPAFEASLKARLPPTPPAHSSFAWVQITSHDNPSVINTSILMITLDDRMQTLTDDLILDVPLPFSGLVISSKTPISPAFDEEFINGFVIQYPPQPPFQGQPASHPPNDVGLSLAMTGEGVGCFRFEGLYDAMPTVTTEPASVVKDFYRVSLDPLNFFDDKRTYMTPIGTSFRLTKEAEGFSIQPL